MKELKSQFAEVLASETSGESADLAELALLATQWLLVSADPARADKAAENSARARQNLAELIDQAKHDLAQKPVGMPGAEPDVVAAWLVDYLSRSHGYRGNVENYYSADNSNLGWVLGERRGIPITLAIVYIAVGRALGFDVRGVGFPGHFLVGVYAANFQADQLIDPFSARLVSRDECMEMLLRQQGRSPKVVGSTGYAIDDALFVPSRAAAIILRVLENLKQIHLRNRATGPALAALELQILAAPDQFELRAQQEALVAQAFGRSMRGTDQPDLH